MGSTGVLEGAVEERGDVRIHRGHVETFDGLKLHFLRWTSEEAEKSDLPVVIIMHGFGEHIERYHELAETFVEAGLVCVGHDARGHGRSDGKRSYVERYEDYTHDLKVMFTQTGARYPDRPLLLLGHSNGGLISIRYVQTHSTLPEALVLSGPLLGLAIAVPRWKSLGSSVLTRLAPSLEMANEIDPADVTRTPEIVDAYANDPLVNTTATPRYFTEMQDAIREAWANVNQLRMPILCFQGGSDKLVDASAVARFMHSVPSDDCTFEELPEHYHEIFNEPDRAERYQETIDWIIERFKD